MKRLRRLWQTLTTLVLAAACWTAVHGAAWAQEPGAKKGGGGGGGSWAMAYGVVIMGIALGILVVCRTSKRRDRARPEVFGEQEEADAAKK